MAFRGDIRRGAGPGSAREWGTRDERDTETDAGSTSPAGYSPPSATPDTPNNEAVMLAWMAAEQPPSISKPTATPTKLESS